MAWTTEEKLRLAEILVVYQLSRSVLNRLLSGKITRGENQLMKGLLRTAGRTAVRGAGTAAMIARKHPVGTALLAGYIAHTQGVSMDTAIMIAQEEVENVQYMQRRVSPLLAPVQIASGVGRLRDIERAPGPPAELFVGREGVVFGKAVKRKVTRANKAVKQGMKWLKEGTKAATGSMPGVLPGQAFRTTVKAAGMANPKTKSKPGKGKSIMNKLARRLKKWW